MTDASGKPEGSVSVSAYRPAGQDSSGTERLLEGADGRVYYFMSDKINGAMAVYEILGSGAKLRLERLTAVNMELGNGSYGQAFGSPEGLLYSGNGQLKLLRGENENSWKDILRWSDSNLGGDPTEVVWISEKQLAAAYFDMEGGHKLYLLTRVKAEDVVRHEELVLASIYISGTLNDWVTEFNQSSERYHITVEEFTRSEEDMARLDAMLVSSNPPDILDLTYMNVMKYADRQALEDLTPYLEKEGMPGKEGLLDQFAEGYTVDGRLVAIPKSFAISVIMGRKSEVGDSKGWTMEEVYALTQMHPKSRLMAMDSFEYVLEELCADYILETFIDWQEGNCRFDSGEFQELMEWMGEQTDRVDRIFAEGDYRGGMVPDDMLLLDGTCYFASDFLRYQTSFGEDMTVIGYPTEEGWASYQGVPDMLLGITSASRHKEGAGQFLEFFLAKKSDFGFPVWKEDIEQLLEDEMTPEFLPGENGEPWLDGNGEPVPRAKGAFTVNGEEIEYYAITKEQADEMRSVIAAAAFTPAGGVRDEVIGIIMEEMRSYLYHEKSLEEVTGIIQNRVRTMVQEGM